MSALKHLIRKEIPQVRDYLPKDIFSRVHVVMSKSETYKSGSYFNILISMIRWKIAIFELNLALIT